MQLTPSTAFLVFATLARLGAAFNPRAAAEAINQGAPIKWTGKIFAERDEFTLYGDVKSIHQQIRSIRPDYNPAEFEPELPKRDLSKRGKNSGGCGSFATASFYDVQYNGSLQQYLAGLGGSCSVDAGPDVCIRLACENTSGIYLCNDNANSIAPGCSYLATYVNDIMGSCHGDSDAVSGQEYDTDGYNIVVAYANCGYDGSYRPDQYQGLPGPNGNPGVVCDGCVQAGAQ